MSKRIAAIDYGLKRIGIALSDSTGSMAFPFATVEGGKKGAAHVMQALEKYKQEITKIIVGLPLLMNGKEGDMAQAVRLFVKELEALADLPILLLDERLSSAQADKSLKENLFNRKKRSSKIDMAAATLLLQNYLDTPKE
jgi:putative Holliday junction resolvase